MSDEDGKTDDSQEGATSEPGWDEALQEQGQTEGAEKAGMENLVDESQPSSQDHPNLEVVLDIPVVISMEVGKTDISIRELLKLSQGSVIELDRFAGDPLDVYINNTLIAHGEVVVVNEKFGIRLTDVVSQAERIKRLA